MSLPSALPSYTEVTSALKSTPAKFNAAQVHGLMCGLICATSGADETQWKTAVLGTDSSPAAQEILLQLYETSYHQMSEFSFEFALLLPSERTDINKRAEALGLWCQGFLTGLEQGKVAIKNRAPSEVTETINDILEISQVNYGDLTNSDEDETAYYELVEYIRLAALMVFHDLKADKEPGTINENNLLH